MSLDATVVTPEEFHPSCSVVICTRDRPEQLHRSLESVSRLVYPRFDVVVVDNAPNDGRTRAVAERRGARYLIEPFIGLSRARNRGARTCNTEIVAFLDDDALAEPQWLASLVREFSDPGVMAVTGRILGLDEKTEDDRSYARLSGIPIGGLKRLTVGPDTPLWFEFASFGGVGIGANMAFRRSAFDVWPGFDERLGLGAAIPGGEESYAFFSLIDRGYRVIYTPDAVVYHRYPRTQAELRAKHIREISSAAGYAMFFIIEEPRYRRAVCRYVWEAMRGVQRTWRDQAAQSRPPIVPRWQTWCARLFGLMRYARSRYARGWSERERRDA